MAKKTAIRTRFIDGFSPTSKTSRESWVHYLGAVIWGKTLFKTTLNLFNHLFQLHGTTKRSINLRNRNCVGEISLRSPSAYLLGSSRQFCRTRPHAPPSFCRSGRCCWIDDPTWSPLVGTRIALASFARWIARSQSAWRQFQIWNTRYSVNGDLRAIFKPLLQQILRWNVEQRTGPVNDVTNNIREYKERLSIVFQS